MKLPVEWLKSHVDVPQTAEELSDQLTLTGTHVEAISQGAGTKILDLEITTNRPDLLSIRGVAREVQAVTGNKARKMIVTEPPFSRKNTLPLKIQIQDRKACNRYVGRVFDKVKVGPAGKTLQDKITWMGQKAINNVVDITNFCLFETGQPLHTFDYDKIKGQIIIVRRAKKGEKIIGINEVEYALDERILVIADQERPIAIAGVMGGLNTQVTSSTERIVLESAHFDPALVRRASRFLKLVTESSYRFERTVPHGRIGDGSLRAAEMLVKHCGAQASSKVMDIDYSKTPATKFIRVGFKEIDDVLGTTVSPAKVVKILTSLGFKVKKDLKKGLRLKSFDERRDVKSKVDVIEEVARVYGFDKIPEAIPVTRHGAATELMSEEYLKIRKLKEFLVAQGLSEVVTYSLLSGEALRNTLISEKGIMKILNPLSQEQELLRPSGLPGILKVISFNVNRREKNLKLFEIGKKFSQGKEENVLSIALTGAYESSWLGSRASTIYHLKGIVENIFDFLKKELPPWNESKGMSEALEELTTLSAGSCRLASLAKVTGKVLSAWDLTAPVLFAEIALDHLDKAKPMTTQYHEIAKYPPVRRDISFTVSKDTTVQDITQAMKKEAAPLLKKVVLFDQFTGKTIPKDRRSLAFSLEYQKPDGTFTDQEIHEVHERITRLLQTRFSAQLRQ